MFSETIKFKIFFTPIYWDQAPKISITLDGTEIYDGTITQENRHIQFTHDLGFGSHTLKIKRYGKTNNQTKKLPNGEFQDQLLELDRLVIDDIDIKDIVNHYSYTKPEYPEPWASLERRKGNNLPELVRGETCWGHNLTWTLKFTSPFYLYVMNWMRGKLNDPAI
jgi:hypothetical protein